MRNLLLLSIAVFSFGITQAQDCTGADHTVLAGSLYYNPSSLTVTAGESIAFLNEAGFHNVNGVSSSVGATWNNPETFSLGANSGAAGGVCMGTITLNTPGTYNYDCSIGSHAAGGMVGTIIVEAAASTTPTDNASDPTLDASDVVGVYGRFIRQQRDQLQPRLGTVWRGKYRFRSGHGQCGDGIHQFELPRNRNDGPWTCRA